MPRNLRRLVSRFFKCYVSRKGYREGGYGLLIALFAGLYPFCRTSRPSWKKTKSLSENWRQL